MLRRVGRALLLVAAAAPVGGTAHAGEGGELSELLGRLERLAGLYADTALGFACEEVVFHHTHAGRSTYRFDYVYRHEEDRGLEDFRVRHRYRPNRPVREKEIVDIGELELPQALLRAYSWIFIFRPGLRERYRFRLLDDDQALGRPARRLAFEGLPPYESGFNDWAGTVWLDRETSQLLQVVARDIEGHRRNQAYRKQLERRDAGQPVQPSFHSIETITTEFAEVKNGMRFPSEVRSERRNFLFPGDARTGRRVYLVRQRYRNYRFFSVRTAAQIRSAVEGGR